MYGRLLIGFIEVDRFQQVLVEISIYLSNPYIVLAAKFSAQAEERAAISVIFPIITVETTGPLETNFTCWDPCLTRLADSAAE
jgi:hypothetical protein|tara:strand:+ start:167 stop:415 length:249 start_codon:yes stop_codon:yes gene_type:complete